MSELAEEQVRVAMKSKEHLKDWLQKTGRGFIVFNAMDLVDSLSWPGGARALQEILHTYREHRRQLPAGGVEVVEVDGEKVEIPKMKDEGLTKSEERRVVNQIVPGASGLVWPSRDLVDES